MNGKQDQNMSQESNDDRIEQVLDDIARREKNGSTPETGPFLERLRERIRTDAAPISIWKQPWLRAALIPLVGALGIAVYLYVTRPSPTPAIPEADVAVVEDLDLLLGLEDLPPEDIEALDAELIETLGTLELLEEIAPEWLEKS